MIVVAKGFSRFFSTISCLAAAVCNSLFFAFLLCLFHLFHYTSFSLFFHCSCALISFFFFFLLLFISNSKQIKLTGIFTFYINFLVIMKLSLCSLSFESLILFKYFFFAFVYFQWAIVTNASLTIFLHCLHLCVSYLLFSF